MTIVNISDPDKTSPNTPMAPAGEGSPENLVDVCCFIAVNRTRRKRMQAT